MSKAQNRADTIKWKKRRKNHHRDKCSNAKCGICSPHKSLGNNKGKNKAKYELEKS
jgi:hypothetical protein